MNDLVPIVPAPGEPDPEPGYYVCRVASGDIEAGALVYLLEISGDHAVVVRGDKTWWVKRPDFRSNFAFDPDGLAHRQAEMIALMSDIANLQSAGMREADLLRLFNPHVADDGGTTGMDLVTTGTGADPLAAKRSIAMVRNQAAKMRTELESRQSQIKAFAEEQAIILRQQATELQAVLQRAEEAVWTINLYLGQNEEIFRLAEGAPAAADEPITIRQLVLFMDEECAVAADEGGIDARAIEAFDEWLTSDPAHLAQVLPEQRGMVALKPRRTRKDYADPWMDHAINKANQKTYFLLRNGDNLFRMWTDFEVGDRLIPRTDEFVSFFSERRHNWTTGKDETIAFKPGSDAFMKAEKAADGRRRHYMRAALILQGLIDRTPVFLPLAWKINVGDEASYVDALRVVLDADLMLSDGRERFKDWFARINGDLGVGQRIVGCFNSWEHGLRIHNFDKSNGNSRISPSGADFPSSNRLFTLEERRAGGFAFFYKRSGSRWSPYEGEVAYQKRAACVVEADDRFILNFDAATVEEMSFFLASRLDRSDYTYLFPTLKLAIRMKHAEASAEAPLRLLPAGEIAKAHKVDVADATASVDDLVRWWKFKNRTHRALTADDAKAVRMIVAEYGHRAVQSTARARIVDQSADMLGRILEAEPQAILIAHKAGAEYVALVPENDDPVFVAEQVWTARGRKAVRRWRTVDARHQRWHALYHGTRWTGWSIGAVAAEHLTDPECESLAQAGWTALAKRRARRRDAVVLQTPLATTLAADGTVELYFSDGGDNVPTEHLLTSRIAGPALGRAKVGWRRDASRMPVVERLDDNHLSVHKTGMPWVVDYNGSPYRGRILWQDATALAAYRAAVAVADQAQTERRVLEIVVSRAFASLERQVLALAERAAHDKFLADFGDEDLWEGHRKTLRLPQNMAGGPALRRALSILVERAIEVDGLTAGEIVDQAGTISGQTITLADDFRGLLVIAAQKQAS